MKMKSCTLELTKGDVDVEIHKEKMAYDCLITNVKIYDGTGKPAYMGGVAVKDGRIAQVGAALNGTANTVIDGAGLALSPGFIDTHSHADGHVFGDPMCTYKLRQGVTTELAGQCGWSRAPLLESCSSVVKDYFVICEKGLEQFGYNFFDTFAQQLDAIENLHLAINQADFVGHHLIRASVMGLENRHATPAEICRMQELTAEAMRSGAMGMSSGMVYVPGIYSSPEEIVALAKVVAQYDGIYTAHIRNEADEVIPAIEEVISVARQTGVRTRISHLKSMFSRNWDKQKEILELINQANADGLDVCFDAYPYVGTSSTLLSALPPSYLTDGVDAMLERLKAPDGLKQFRRDIFEPTEDWENPIRYLGLHNFFISFSPSMPEATGMTIAEYSSYKGIDPLQAFVDLLVGNGGGILDIRFAIREENIKELYCHPACTLGTDGLFRPGNASGLPHPRACASFPRYLGRYIREEGILSREEGIRHITGLPADQYQLQKKGYLLPDYDADMVLFDYDTILDQATYDNPLKPNIGIHAVWVGGELALKDNELTGARNGHVLRRHQGVTEQNQ